MKNLIVLFAFSLFLFIGCQQEGSIPVSPQSDTKTDISKNLKYFDINLEGVVTSYTGSYRNTAEGSGHSSRFGEFTCFMDSRILNDGIRNNITGVLLITTYEGDEFKSEFTGDYIQNEDGAEYNLSMIILGGSGRFEGAAGRMNFVGKSSNLSPLTSILSLEGTGWMN